MVDSKNVVQNPRRGRLNGVRGEVVLRIFVAGADDADVRFFKGDV